MIVEDNFSTCKNGDCALIVEQKQVPVFQNKVYPSLSEALKAETGKVQLVQSNQSGFIFNRLFNPDIMNYDENYQNEQGNSSVFKEHLSHVLGILKSFSIADKKIVEVGCGKGVFFEMMLKEGFDCTGFDPTYEGNNPRIRKDYFNEKYNDVNADVIIMRHTLEHIPNPFSFIHSIAKANNYKGYLFVEVPTFDWISEKKSFWDVFYEHCNYFTEKTLSIMFEHATTGNFFGGQYIYLWADLSGLRNKIPQQEITKPDFSEVQKNVDEFIAFLKANKSIAIWGAGAKGSTYLNLVDPDRKLVQYVIDINPVKQSKFIACTGHPIYSPAILDSDKVNNILVMNENYLEEIRESLKTYSINIFNL
jgi:hypothetical protein